MQHKLVQYKQDKGVYLKESKFTRTFRVGRLLDHNRNCNRNQHPGIGGGIGGYWNSHRPTRRGSQNVGQLLPQPDGRDDEDHRLGDFALARGHSVFGGRQSFGNGRHRHGHESAGLVFRNRLPGIVAAGIRGFAPAVLCVDQKESHPFRVQHWNGHRHSVRNCLKVNGPSDF